MHHHQLGGKRVLVVGGSGGIGGAVAEACGRAGAWVGVGYASGEARARAVVERIRADGGRAEPIRVDLSEPEAAGRAVAALEGGVDGLVNAAGLHVAGPLLSLSQAEIGRQLRVNLEGAIAVTQAALTAMVSRRSGSIVHLGSVSAHRVVRGHSVYSATKAALEGFTRAVAGEVARRNVRVNCVVPGPVPTPMLQKTIDETGDDPARRVPMARLIEAREVADTVLFLLSDAASAITGTMIPVDGGYLLG
jgi:3-oxoacyl-[acyl-carrier protein] reductase